jgi:hypothetical protein
MTIRTDRTTISFKNAFRLAGIDSEQPAGDYVLDTDHELIEGLSRLAYRRVATVLQLPSISAHQGSLQRVSVNQNELDAALMKDRGETV